MVKTAQTELVIQALRRAAQLAEAAMERGLRELGITARQFQILSLIANSPKLSQTAVVDATGIDRSTMAEVARRLKERGLITRVRDRRDARAYQLNLTEEGRALLRKAIPVVQKADAALLALLPDEGRRLSADLRALNSQLEEALLLRRTGAFS